MWEIAAIIFSGVLFLLSLLIAKYVFDSVQEFKQGLQDLKVQVFNSSRPSKDFENISVKMAGFMLASTDRLDALTKKTSDLEYYAMRPQSINLYTKEPLMVEQIKTAAPRASRAQIAKEAEIKKLVNAAVKEILNGADQPHDLPHNMPPPAPQKTSRLERIESGILHTPNKASNFDPTTVKTVKKQMKDLNQ